MATNFPTSLDSLTNPATTDQLNSPSHAAQHANANDAIEQLQAKVGVNSSAVTTSHDYKIAQLEAAITAGVSGTKLIYQDVRNQSGVSLTKGTPVRVTGSDGASGKLLVVAASNATEAGSSKTFGLVSSTISNNSNGQVITNGLVEGVDTTGAVDGDPVWLGVNGAKIFGLANKPVAPAHLVYLGVVVRGGQQNTGSIFVSIQNGFEVEELHNVLITSLANKDALVYDSTAQLWKNYDLSNDFVLSGDLQNSLGDYIPLNALGQPSGPATLDADGNLIVPENKIIIEGATADAHELTLQAPDVVSDITVTLPNAAGTLALTSDITTAVNNLVNSAPNTLDTLNELATALGNDANFATTTATSIGNKVSKAGGDVITSSTASTVPLVLKGSASQTAALQEWQNNAGAVLSYIRQDGAIALNTMLPTSSNTGSYLTTGSGAININSRSTSTSTFNVIGNESQTADLQQWQTSTGSIVAKVTPYALQVGSNPAYPSRLLLGNGDTTALLSIITHATNQIGAVIRGQASQTSNLLEFQNSSGNPITYVTASGHITASSAAISTLYSGGQLQSGTMGYFNATTFAPSVSPIVVRGTISQSADLTQWQNVGGTVLAKINSAGELTTPNLALSTYGGIYAPGSYMVLNPADTRIVSTGLSVGATSVAPSAQLQVTNNVAGTTAMIVKAAASQTADLQQWQDSAGNILSRISPNGLVNTSAILSKNNYSSYFSFADNQPIFANPLTAAHVALVVKGAPSQTSNLQEWQNSAAASLFSIGPDGSFKWSDGYSGPGKFYWGSAEIGGFGNGIATGQTWYFRSYNSARNAMVVQGQPNQSVASVIIRADSSQTGNLQEWQNSAGTVLSKIDSAGAMFTTTAAANTNTTQVATTAYVQTELADLVNSAPATLDTLKELSDALGADANFATTVTNNLALKAPLASPALTGTPTAPTAAVGTDSTQVATTAFVIDQIDASTQPGALYQTTAPTSPEIGQIWIDSDDNVTVFDSNIIRRQPFTATAGQTNFVTTVPFIDGFEQVYFNGLLLLKTTDYTTSGNNTVILGSAAAVNDIIEVVTVTNLNSVNTYTQAETDALLAANTSVAPLSISANTNLLAKKRYFVTSASALTLTLPASPALNDEIQILDASGNASTYNITVARNGRLINGNAGNLIIDMNGAWTVLVYTGATYGWKVG